MNTGIIYKVSKDQHIVKDKFEYEFLRDFDRRRAEVFKDRNFFLLSNFLEHHHKNYLVEDLNERTILNGILFPCGTFVYCPRESSKDYMINSYVESFQGTKDAEEIKDSLIIFNPSMSFNREILFNSVYCNSILQKNKKMTESQQDWLIDNKEKFSKAQESDVDELLKLQATEIKDIDDERIYETPSGTIMLLEKIIYEKDYELKEEKLKLLALNSPWLFHLTASCKNIRKDISKLINSNPIASPFITIIPCELEDSIKLIILDKKDHLITGEELTELFKYSDFLAKKYNMQVSITIYVFREQLDGLGRCLLRNSSSHLIKFKNYNTRIEKLREKEYLL